MYVTGLVCYRFTEFYVYVTGLRSFMCMLQIYGVYHVFYKFTNVYVTGLRSFMCLYVIKRFTEFYMYVTGLQVYRVLRVCYRFTEFYVDELEEEGDLRTLVSDYLSSLSLTPTHIQGVVRFYLAVKRAATDKLTDGTGHKPHFSLRTLCRALRYAASNPCGQVSRSLYEVSHTSYC